VLTYSSSICGCCYLVLFFCAPPCSLDYHAAPSLQRDELLLVRRNPCLPRRLRGTRFGSLNPRLPSHTFKFEIRKRSSREEFSFRITVFFFEDHRMGYLPGTGVPCR